MIEIISEYYDSIILIFFLLSIALLVFFTCYFTKSQSLLTSMLWTVSGVLIVGLIFFIPLDEVYDKNIIALITIGFLCLMVYISIVRLNDSDLVNQNKKIINLLKKQNEKIEEERKSITSMLHDEINPKQLLAKMALGRLKKKNTAMSVESIEILEHAERNIEESYQEIRNIIKLTRLEIFDSMGIIHAINDLISNYKSVVSNISIDFKCVSEEIIADEKKLIIAYRIVQEAMLNAIKHSNANKVKVEIIEEKNKYIISIKDNGIGFNTELVHNGIGMTDMVERAASIGSKLNVKTVVYSGTEINFLLKKK